MAERRMFAKTIIDSDAFLDMPLSTQSLYFHLSMRADDDGFINNPKKVQRMVGCADDDLKLLIAKNFIIPFESGIVVIKHWKIHNYIRGDRKKDTVYPEEMALLIEKDNGAYSLKSNDHISIESSAEETKRQKAYRESTLPYSFEYKIRQAFYGQPCPVCGFKMQSSVDECGVGSDIRKPSIQHNVPISKGGKHELGNISVICHQCNVTLKDKETDRLNADEVIKVWDEICMSGKCLSSDGQVTDKCQHRLGKDSIDKNSINIYDENFEVLWKMLKSTPYDRKSKVTKKRKKELYDMGVDRTKKAIEVYMQVQDPKYYHKRDNFLNEIIDNYLDKETSDFNNQSKQSKNCFNINEDSLDDLF